MSVQVTCKSRRSAELLPDSYTGPLPEYVIRFDDADPTLAWLTAVREGYALHAKQPAWLEGRSFPRPDGKPWSDRGIETGPQPYPSEVWYSVAAWRRRLPGSRYQLSLETMDAGFIVTWTLEIV